jgi:hypothetical protein
MLNVLELGSGISFSPNAWAILFCHGECMDFRAILFCRSKHRVVPVTFFYPRMVYILKLEIFMVVKW